MNTIRDILLTLKTMPRHAVLTDIDAEQLLAVLVALQDEAFFWMVAGHIPDRLAARFESGLIHLLQQYRKGIDLALSCLRLSRMSEYFSFDRMADAVCDEKVFFGENCSDLMMVNRLAELAEISGDKINLHRYDELFLSSLEHLLVDEHRHSIDFYKLNSWLLMNPDSDKARAAKIVESYLAKGGSPKQDNLEFLLLSLPGLNVELLNPANSQNKDAYSPLQAILFPNKAGEDVTQENWPKAVKQAEVLFASGQKDRAIGVIDRAYACAMQDVGVSHGPDVDIVVVTRIYTDSVKLIEAMNTFGVMDRYNLTPIKKTITENSYFWLSNASIDILDPLYFLEYFADAKYFGSLSHTLVRCSELPQSGRDRIALTLWNRFPDLIGERVTRDDLMDVLKHGVSRAPDLARYAALAVAASIGALEKNEGWVAFENRNKNGLLRRGNFMFMHSAPTAVAVHFIDVLQSCGFDFEKPGMAVRGSPEFKRALHKKEPMAYVLETVFGEPGLQAANMAKVLLPDRCTGQAIFQLLSASGLPGSNKTTTFCADLAP